MDIPINNRSACGFNSVEMNVPQKNLGRLVGRVSRVNRAELSRNMLAYPPADYSGMIQ